MSTYRLRARLLSNDDTGERQAMRMLYWWSKHKLEAIEFGVSDFETEWLPYQLVSGRDGVSTGGRTDHAADTGRRDHH